MEFHTVEIRSEEEFIGNILWLTCPKESVDYDMALMSLWIEAQEYSPDYSESNKVSDYKREEKLFLNEEITPVQCINKVNQYFDKVYSRKFDDLFEIAVNGKRVKEQIFSPFIGSDSTIKVIECNNTDFSVFIIDSDKYMLFSWTDVV